jgi:SAM-dependent methyltransferase
MAARRYRHATFLGSSYCLNNLVTKCFLSLYNVLKMKATKSPERRRDTDIIPPGNMPRSALDRPIKDVDRLFSDAFGWNKSPTQAAATIARTQGKVALLDLGCGAANTLRTWGRAVSLATPCALGSISLTGVDKYDYSRDSGYPATIAACESGAISYIVADATDMPIEPNSADVTLAYTVLSHSDEPVDWVRAMLRATRAGGIIFFTAASHPQYEVGAPLPEFLRSVGDGRQFAVAHAVIETQSGRLGEMTLCRLEVPEG